MYFLFLASDSVSDNSIISGQHGVLNGKRLSERLKPAQA